MPGLHVHTSVSYVVLPGLFFPAMCTIYRQIFSLRNFLQLFLYHLIFFFFCHFPFLKGGVLAVITRAKRSFETPHRTI